MDSYISFIENLSETKSRYTSFIEANRIRNRAIAADFNLFRILGVEHYEVSTHSAMLRDLLDSNGSHGQGNLFFLSFLHMLARNGIITQGDVDKYSSITFDNYVCEAERAVDMGRIDIILERLDCEFPFCFIIENKVWAVDQEKQIERYWQELDGKLQIPLGRKRILYLSLDGHLPSEWSIDPQVRADLEAKKVLYCISYKQDIRQWLENVLPEVKSEKVKFAVLQYIDIIKQITGGFMSDLDKTKYEFITQPDNWQFAKELFEIMPGIQKQIVENFWEDVRLSLEKISAKNGWDVVRIEDYEKYNQSLGLCITHHLWRGMFHVGMGDLQGSTFNAVWCDSTNKELQDQLYLPLADALNASDNRLQKDDQWWPGWYYTNDNFADLSTLDKILPSNRCTLVEKYSEMLIDLKDKAAPIINAAMAKL